ncbi:Efflux pump membrane transporter BepE, partial [Durusdinium trenchii]
AYKAIPEASIQAFPPPSVPGMGAVGGLELVLEDTLGRSQADLAGAMQILLAAANESAKIGNASTSFRANVPMYRIDIDRNKAKTLQVPLTNIFSVLQAQLGSSYINDFSLFGRTFRVMMQADPSYRSDLRDIERLYARSTTGEMVPLATLLTTEPVLGADITYRFNLYRSAILRAQPAAGVASGDAMDELERIAAEVLPQGYQAYKAIPEASIQAFPPPSVPGMGAVGGLELVLEDTLGRSQADLAGAMQILLAAANESAKIGNASTSFRANVPMYRIDIDRNKAKTLQVPLTNIFSVLQAQLGSSYINDFSLFGRTFRVMMQADPSYRSDLRDIERLYARSTTGEMVPLATLLTTEPVLGADITYRFNLYRSAILRAQPAAGVASGDAMDELERIAAE